MKGTTDKNLFQLDTGTVQELFQKDIKKGRSDLEDDFEKQVFADQNRLHTSCSVISIKTESLYDDDLIVNISTLLEPEGGSLADEYDRENRTRFGLETIVEEMHDQSEDAIADCRTESGLVYDEYEVDLGGQTSEELRRSEEFQRFLQLLSKTKNMTQAEIHVASDASVGEKGRNILIETTTNRKVECTLNEVENTKYYLKGDGLTGSNVIFTEGVPSDGDCGNCEVKEVDDPSECPKIEHRGMSHPKCNQSETSPSEASKPKKSSGRTKLGKSEKRHGSASGSKKCSKSDRKRQGWVTNRNFDSFCNVISDRIKGFLAFLLPKPNNGENPDVLTILGDAALKAVSVRNVVSLVILFAISSIMANAKFHKPPGLMDVVMRRFRKRRTPFEIFYDKILSLLRGLIVR